MICHSHRSSHSTSQYYSTTAGTPLPAHQHWPHTVHTQCTVLVGWEYLHYSQPSTSYSSSPLAVCCRVVSYGRFTAFSCNGTITLYNADREVCWKQEYDFFDGRQVLSHCALTQGCWFAGCWVSPLSSVCPVVLLCAASVASCHSDPSILGPILMVLRDAHAAVSLCTVAVAAQRPEWSIPRYRCSAHSALSTFTLAPIRVQWLWTCRTERSNGRSLCVSRECD